MTKNIIIGVLVLVIIAGAGWYYLNMDSVSQDRNGNTPTASVSSFEDCEKAGFPIMESYPRQCRTSEGKTFIENIGNALEKENLIRLDSPRPNAVLTSPLVVEGEARGTWYFEASFPVTLTDANGKIIARTPAQAQDEWMTENFVPFKAGLKWDSMPQTDTGFLILEKDNPSGLPENDDQLKIPVRFK